MSDLVTFGGGVPANADDLQSLAKGLTNVTANIQGATGGLPFLRLLRTGVWAYGVDATEPEPGSHWAINPFSIHHGWACWGDGELLGEVMVRFDAPLPPKTELQDFGPDWGQQFGMMLQCIDGEDKGTQVQLKGTSLGLKNAVKKLIDEIISQINNDPEKLVPVVELEVDSYHHKKYGEIFTPVLDVVKWLPMGGPGDGGDKAPVPEDDDEDDAPPPKAAKANKANGASDGDDKKPTRRRRRSA